MFRDCCSTSNFNFFPVKDKQLWHKLTVCEEVRAFMTRPWALNRLEQMTVLFMTVPTPSYGTHMA